MKKYSFISIVLVLSLLISSMGTLPVFASETEPKLLFDLDMSGFDKTIEGTWGLTNKAVDGDEVTITARDGYNDEDQSSKITTGVSTKKSLKASNTATPVDYILQTPQNNTDSSRSQETENTRIIIENKDWAAKSTTTEIWVYKTKKTIANYLNFFRDTGDRQSFDKILWVGEDNSSNTTLEYKGSTVRWNVGGNGEARWYLFTLVATASDKDEDGNDDTMTYKLQVNKNTADNLVQTVDISEDEYYGISLGSLLNTNFYVPNELGFASVKVYDGALTKDQIDAHFDAEKAAFGITNTSNGLSMVKPAVSSVSPANGASIACHGNTFKVNFSQPVDADTIEEGVIFKNSSGDIVSSEKTLSSDGKTLTVTVGAFPTGGYSLVITSALKGLNGKNIDGRTYTYTANPLEIKLDFTDRNVWTKGTTYTTSTISDVVPNLVNPGVSTSVGTTYSLLDDETLTVVNSSNVNAALKINLGTTIQNGIITADFWFKSGTMDNPRVFAIQHTGTTSSQVGQQILGTLGSTYKLGKPKAFDASATDLFTKDSLTTTGSDRWFHILVVMSRETMNDDWNVKLYNLSQSDSECLYEYDSIGTKNGITAFYLGVNKKGYGLYLKDIKIKHYTSYIGGFTAHSDSSREKVEYAADLKTVMEDAVIIAALYHGDKLIAYNTHSMTDINEAGGKISGIFENYETINDDPSVKLMMWDSLEGLRPLTTSLEKAAPENVQ